MSDQMDYTATFERALRGETMALVEILANGQHTGVIVDADELREAHRTWYANNRKCGLCSFLPPHHAPGCRNEGRVDPFCDICEFEHH
jgi:hypothetical protein